MKMVEAFKKKTNKCLKKYWEIFFYHQLELKLLSLFLFKALQSWKTMSTAVRMLLWFPNISLAF